METQIRETTPPANVPKDRVVDFDIFAFEVENGEYQRALKKLTDAGAPDVIWTPRNGGHWIATRFEAIGVVLGDNDHFSANELTVPKQPPGTPKMRPLQSDPPEHVKFKNLLAPALAPKPVAKLGEVARALTISLIDGFKDRGRCEFIGEFAQHLPIAIFMQIVDLPDSDRLDLTGWAEKALRGETEDIRRQGRMQVAAYGMQKVMERRANPGQDLISNIATARIDGELLDETTLTGMVTLLLFAGLDTVASMLGFFARFLAMNPSYRRQLIDDPTLIPNAVEELLRRFPIILAAREVKADCDFYGVTLKTGDMVVAPTPLAGLDERQFADPLTVDFKRPKPIHDTFGAGTHRCMGSMLARIELRIFLEEWLKRIPDFEIEPGAEVKVSARQVATITSLPLVWKTA
jgi:cytochrome P450